MDPSSSFWDAAQTLMGQVRARRPGSRSAAGGHLRHETVARCRRPARQLESLFCAGSSKRHRVTPSATPDAIAKLVPPDSTVAPRGNALPGLIAFATFPPWTEQTLCVSLPHPRETVQGRRSRRRRRVALRRRSLVWSGQHRPSTAVSSESAENGLARNGNRVVAAALHDLFRVSRDQQYSQAGPCPAHTGGQLRAAHARHDNVREQQVRRLRHDLRGEYRFVRARGGGYVEAGAAQYPLGDVTQAGLVLDEEDAAGSANRLFPARSFGRDCCRPAARA